MRVLIGCARSGVLGEAFRRAGHFAMECDTEPTRADPTWHLQQNILTVDLMHWDMAIIHPPCTYLSVSGLHWNKRRPERAALTDEAAQFFMACVGLVHRLGRGVVENPVGCMSTRWRKPSQYVQPYQFGDDASKATGLWLHNLPLLTPTTRVPGRWINGRERWANQTDSSQNRLGPSDDRAEKRSETYPGIARAMASQWGSL